MKNWNEAEIAKLQAKGMVVNSTLVKDLSNNPLFSPVDNTKPAVRCIEPSDKKSVVKSLKKEPEGKRHIRRVLEAKNLQWVEEYKFDTVRRWKFDYAVPHLMLAIEYEGMNSAVSGHLTFGGYTKNCEKYNQAQLQGWTVLRYTMKNFLDFNDDIATFIRNYRPTSIHNFSHYPLVP